MKQIIAILFVACGLLSAQVNPPTIWRSSRTTPSGNCAAGTGVETIPGGVLYTCQAGTWVQISGGGGSSIAPFTTDGTNVTLPNGNLSVGNTVLDPVQGVSNPVAAMLPKWRLALANVRAGIADANILCMGDSTTAGAGGPNSATVPQLDSACWQLGVMLATDGIPWAPGFLPMGNPAHPVHNAQLTYGTDWTDATFGFSGSSSLKTTTDASNLVFTPAGGFAYDRFDVYYVRNTGDGTLTMTATGGTPVVQLTAGTGALLKVTVSAATAATNNTLTIVPSSGTVYVWGIEPWLSTTKRVRIGNAGQYGTTSSQWALTGPFYTPGAVTLYSPNLSICSLGINDATTSVSPATLQTNLQAIITSAETTGDVMLWTMPPSSGSPYTTVEPTYQAVYASLATTNNVPLVDIWKRFGGVWNSSWMNDFTHPNLAGYWDIASAIYRTLRQAQ
jgi:lysophospholipase L1-like esterase